MAPAEPDSHNVELVHLPSGLKEVRRIKDFLPLVRDDGVVQDGLLPLSGMTVQEIVSHDPAIKLVEPDELESSSDEEEGAA